MKWNGKWLVGLLMIVLIATLQIVAQADERINPNRSEAMRHYRMGLQEMTKRSALLQGAAGQVSLSMEPKNPKPGSTVTFTVNLNGSFSSDSVDVLCQISDVDYGLLYSNHVGSTVKYKFYCAGTYYCRIWVYSGDTIEAYDGIDFTIDDDGINPTLKQKAQEVVNACKGNSKWETALNLYDWLQNAVEYDDDGLYYGVDMIFRGTGVCDSYSKVYLLLCQTAGITAEHVTSISHAWNTVNLDGNWYQLDATWDDPGGSEEPQHQFFFLNSAAMQSIENHQEMDVVGHVWDCKNMALNYYIKTGRWENWGSSLLDNTTGSYAYLTWIEAAQKAYDRCCASYVADVTWPMYVENGSGYLEDIWRSEIIREIVMYGYTNFTGWKLSVGGAIQVEAQMTDKTHLEFRLKGWNLTETGTLRLPDNVKQIEEQAFANVKATTVVIPETCTTIGENALANSRVRTVYIPSSVLTIEETAFEGCERIAFVTPLDSRAASFAMDHGMLLVEP